MKRGSGFEASFDVSREGCTFNGTYAESSIFFSKLRENTLRNMIGKEKELFETQT